MTRSRDLANLADGTEFSAADHSKLDGIEASATADQTSAQIKAAVEAASDSNVFTDADHSKLNGVAAGATDNTVASAALPKAGGAVTGNVTFGDGNKAIFGAGSDLQIYHDGNSKITDVGDGKLELHSNGTGVFIQKGATEYMAQFLTDGAVTLYHDNASKLATTATGVDVTGALNIEGASGTQLVVEASSGNFAQMDFKIGGTQKGAIWVNEATDLMGYYAPSGWGKNFYTNGAERMRIDSSGNVLVGKTTTALATAGITLGESGFGSFTRSGYEPLNVNRLSSDGDLAKFYKDGSAVGSIGVSGSDLFVGRDNCTLKYGNNELLPAYTGNGNVRNDAISLGSASGNFKDLYLSGGVYLGGTGSANKISDFETGTFTPNVNNLTLSQVSAKYVKVGTLVSFSVQFLMPSTSDSSSGMSIAGLPFTTSGDGAAAMGYTTAGDFVTNPATLLIQSTTIYFYRGGGLRPVSAYSGAYVRLSGHYITAA